MLRNAVGRSRIGAAPPRSDGPRLSPSSLTERSSQLPQGGDVSSQPNHPNTWKALLARNEALRPENAKAAPSVWTPGRLSTNPVHQEFSHETTSIRVRLLLTTFPASALTFMLAGASPEPEAWPSPNRCPDLRRANHGTGRGGASWPISSFSISSLLKVM